MKIFTIGFTQKSAAKFFGMLLENQIQLLVDIRVHPDGQLSGFARRGDLQFFLDHLADHCNYVYVPELAPTESIMKEYRESRNWDRYAEKYSALMDSRNIPQTVMWLLEGNQNICLLCSEPTAEHCHRSLAARRLAEAIPNIEVIHL